MPIFSFRGQPLLSIKDLRVVSLIVVLTLVFVLPAAGVFAQEPLTLDIDLSALFTNINTFLPVAFAIFAVIGGLLIAFRLARFLVNAFADALDGKNI